MVYVFGGALVLLALCYACYVFSLLKKSYSNNAVSKNESSARRRCTPLLYRWRGGMRVGTGRVKTESEFYEIEKNLRYNK